MSCSDVKKCGWLPNSNVSVEISAVSCRPSRVWSSLCRLRAGRLMEMVSRYQLQGFRFGEEFQLSRRMPQNILQLETGQPQETFVYIHVALIGAALQRQRHRAGPERLAEALLGTFQLLLGSGKFRMRAFPGLNLLAQFPRALLHAFLQLVMGRLQFRLGLQQQGVFAPGGQRP